MVERGIETPLSIEDVDGSITAVSVLDNTELISVSVMGVSIELNVGEIGDVSNPVVSLVRISDDAVRAEDAEIPTVTREEEPEGGLNVSPAVSVERDIDAPPSTEVVDGNVVRGSVLNDTELNSVSVVGTSMELDEGEIRDDSEPLVSSVTLVNGNAREEDAVVPSLTREEGSTDGLTVSPAISELEGEGMVGNCVSVSLLVRAGSNVEVADSSLWLVGLVFVDDAGVTSVLLGTSKEAGVGFVVTCSLMESEIGIVPMAVEGVEIAVVSPVALGNSAVASEEELRVEEDRISDVGKDMSSGD